MVWKRREKEARQEAQADLPSLRPFVESYRREARTFSKVEALRRQLSACARTIRKVQPQHFYKTREIADAFHVSLSAVSEALRKIQQHDGILRVVRGSQVILTGTRVDREVRVRVMVGMPIAVGEFITYDPYRRFFLNMRSDLRRAGCSGAMAFYYQTNEARHPDFVERLRQYEVDTVIWFAPESGVIDTLRSLGENNVRIICIGEESYSPTPQHYQVQRSHAVGNALQSISDEGLQILRPRHPSLRSRALRNERVDDILRDCGQELPYTGSDTADLLRYLDKLEKVSGVAIIFQQAAFVQFIAQRAPERLFRLMEKRRVVLVNGAPTFHYTALPAVQLDLVRVDWPAAAGRLVRDLLEDHVPAPEEQAVFRAAWLPRSNLSEIANAFSVPI